MSAGHVEVEVSVQTLFVSKPWGRVAVENDGLASIPLPVSVRYRYPSVGSAGEFSGRACYMYILWMWHAPFSFPHTLSDVTCMTALPLSCWAAAVSGVGF